MGRLSNLYMDAIKVQYSVPIGVLSPQMGVELTGKSPMAGVDLAV